MLDHGLSKYVHEGCRCDECRAANAARSKRNRKLYPHPEYTSSPAFKAKQKAYNRTYKYLNKYGMTEADYDIILEQQGGLCAICGTDEAYYTRAYDHFHTDHCHLTGVVRGLLCNTCNRALGLLHDDPHILEVALAYLQSDPVHPGTSA